MIGWFEENGILSIEVQLDTDGWYYINYLEYKYIGNSYNRYDSRKEATLAAIDAALEYLTNNNK